MTTTPITDETILEVARRFGAEVIEPQAEAWNAAGHAPRQFFAQAAEVGLCRLIVPREHGGAALGVATMAEVTGALARHCLASTFALVVHNNLAGAIARYGNTAQRERYLPALMRGETVGAFLLTEPGAGSDAAAITTRARRDGDAWVLDGRKAWVSNAATADVLSVYAQTEPGTGAPGIACFLVDADAPGVTREATYPLLGGHALGTGGFTFEHVRLEPGALMIPAGSGFRAALSGIDIARVNVAAMCAGALERALEVAVDYVREREAFGRTLGEFQGVQWMLAECATDLEAAKLLAGAAAVRLDAGEAASVAAAHAKKFATRVAFTRIADCMQTLGAAGLSRSYPLSRLLEAAKIAQYLDGATEIQNVVIARALLARTR